MSDTAPQYLVTGASGFVGKELVTHIASHGVPVRAMVRSAEKKQALADIADEVVIGDLADEESLRNAASGMKGIYHIAAAFRQEKADRNFFWEANVEGTRRLLDSAIEAGVERFVYCSTVGVHGDVRNPPADENAPFAPGDDYQESKLAAEQLVLDYLAKGRIRGVVIRPSMVYGPGDQRTLKIFRMIAKGVFFYIGSGNVQLHWIDVRDLAAGFKLAMDAEHLTAETFILAGAKPVLLTKMAYVIAQQLGVRAPWLKVPTSIALTAANVTSAVCDRIGVEPPIYKRRVSFYLNNRAFSWSKAHRELGYSPSQTFEKEIADIITEYRRLQWI